jgi:hypothetical protein
MQLFKCLNSHVFISALITNAKYQIKATLVLFEAKVRSTQHTFSTVKSVIEYVRHDEQQYSERFPSKIKYALYRA